MELNSAKKTKYPADIQVTEDWKLKSDKFGWHIFGRQRDKDGKKTGWVQEFFLPTPLSALNTLWESMTQEAPARDFTQLKKNFREVADIIIKTAEKLKEI